MHHGVLPLFKPAGMTSHDCVGKLRRLTKIKKIGHTGTLDPDVTGVLPLCIGQATRVAEYVLDLPKEYEGKLTLGRSTDTGDASGATVKEQKIPRDAVTQEQVAQVFSQFLGATEQIPPMYSAVKVKGKRLHQLARQGKEVERKPRKIHIYQLDLLDMMGEEDQVTISFRVTCSKGTYIRVLCEDMGAKLGFPAHMSHLIRTRSGPYEIADCVTFDKLEAAMEQNNWASYLQPVDSALPHFDRYQATEQQAEAVLNGRKLYIEKETLPPTDQPLVRIYAPGDQFIAIYRKQESLEEGQMVLAAEKVFRELGGAKA